MMDDYIAILFDVICRVGSLEILRPINADVKLLSITLANWAVLLLCAPIYFLILP